MEKIAQKILIFILVVSLCVVPCLALEVPEGSESLFPVIQQTQYRTGTTSSFLWQNAGPGGSVSVPASKGQVRLWVRYRTDSNGSFNLYQEHFTYKIEIVCNREYYPQFNLSNLYAVSPSYAYEEIPITATPGMVNGTSIFTDSTIVRQPESSQTIYTIIFQCQSDFGQLVPLFTAQTNPSFTSLEFEVQSIEAYADLQGSKYNQLVLNKFDEVKDQLADGQAQMHADNVALMNILQSNSDRDHEDNEKIEQAIKNINDEQWTKTEENSNVDDSISNAEDTLDISEFKASITSLYDAFTYEGWKSSIVFPSSGNVPFIGKLWDSQNVDLTEWVYKLPPSFLVVIRFLFSLCIVFLIIRDIQGLIKFISKGDDDD